MKSIDFSIIIPVYNASSFLRVCLMSVINQSHRNIEIICVDDASSDESLKILRQFSREDGRIRIIVKSINEGTSKARKDGVLYSNGKHVLFVDADDILLENTCERLLEVYAEKKADIIQFDAYVNACNGIGINKVNEVEQYLKPCCAQISIKEMQNLCFNIGSLSHSLWGKMFDGDICRQAFEYVSNDKLILAEDMYALFIISVFAKTYAGIPDKLYQYNYGMGITGVNQDFFKALRDKCRPLLIIPKCYEFIEEIGEMEKYTVVVEGIRRYLSDVLISFWMNYNKKIDDEDIIRIQEILVENCSSFDLGYICSFFGMYCQNRELAMKKRGWVFPYHCVSKGSKVIIYGAGNVGKDYYDQLIKTGYCEIVAWVDRAYDSVENTESVIQSPKIIKTLDYDYIIVAIKDMMIRNTVIKYLINMNVKEDAIVQI